ncbi:MAG: RNA repair transcriptional activator RtcR [Planctomycetes bacterium]|nr:RNA repair transcriptional activator RtcR [Planctomycetota bacterium]
MNTKQPKLRTVVLGIVGRSLDMSPAHTRWDRWRPTVDLCRQEDLVVDQLELFVHAGDERLAATLTDDIRSVSPETDVRQHPIAARDFWDFEEVFATFHDFARAYPFDTDREQYYVHITTGTHVEQICLFLLCESRHFPARLVQMGPPRKNGPQSPGSFKVIDLDLSRYDRLASRFRKERREAASVLKGGIETRNAAFNALIARIEHVALASKAPVLLTGPTGAGKSALARRLYELRRARRQVDGALVEVNCATLRGDAAMSTLFGHVKGAFTGALQDRPGLLRAADHGMLFLDEIGELGLDEQAMLLRALEEKTFLPLGADSEVRSDFQLLAGTNRDLASDVRAGRFREDLLRRIDLWTFRLPGLRDRAEDVEPNLAWELDQFSRLTGHAVTFSREARDAFVAFATSPEATWPGNFRDFNAAVVRMSTLARGGRIDVALVREEIDRLRAAWDPQAGEPGGGDAEIVAHAVGARRADEIDLFDRAQLAEVLRVCSRSRSLSDAGRALFAASRARKTSSNDADRLRKYLARWELTFADAATPQ